MAKRNKNVEVDPTLAYKPVKIDEKTYNCCFDFQSLADAEAELAREGKDVNLLVALPRLNVSSIRTIFPCALRRLHPELSFEQARNLVRLDTVMTIAYAIVDAWGMAHPTPDPMKVAAEEASKSAATNDGSGSGA